MCLYAFVQTSLWKLVNMWWHGLWFSWFLLLAGKVAGEAGLVYYGLLVDSFKDTDGDGLGDLRGVSKQLSYVKTLSADAIILSIIVSRSLDCDHPGVLDFTEIDQRYGNLDEFNAVLEKGKKLEIKVLVTLPVQTVSEASELFNFSATRVPGSEDRILWKDGNPDEPPPPEENFTWIWNDIRKSYYAVSKDGALLNLCSETVVSDLAAAQCAWIKRGVAGVVLNSDYEDEQCGEKMMRKMAAEAMSCSRAANMETPILIAESTLKPDLAAKYYANDGLGAKSVISRTMSSPKRKSAAELGLAFHEALLYSPEDSPPTWRTSSLNESRITSRFGSEMVDAINLLTLILPGSAIIQQGDEIGAADTILEWVTSSKCWPGLSAPSSAPFPWDESANGGFTTGDPWLPLAPNYRYANAKTEFVDDMSHLGVVRVAAALRKSPAIGPHVEIKRLGESIAVLRWGGSGSLLVVANVAQKPTEVQLYKIPGLPTEMTVAASSYGSSFSMGSHQSLEKTLKMIPGEAVLLVGPPRHCGGPGPVDKITNKLSEGWQKINKYFSGL